MAHGGPAHGVLVAAIQGKVRARFATDQWPVVSLAWLDLKGQLISSWLGVLEGSGHPKLTWS